MISGDVAMLLLKQSIDYRCCHYAFFEVIKSWLSKLLLRLCEIKYVVMDLESNTKVRTKVKKMSVSIFVGKVHDYCHTSAA